MVPAKKTTAPASGYSAKDLAVLEGLEARFRDTALRPDASGCATCSRRWGEHTKKWGSRESPCGESYG